MKLLTWKNALLIIIFLLGFYFLGKIFDSIPLLANNTIFLGIGLGILVTVWGLYFLSVFLEDKIKLIFKEGRKFWTNGVKNLAKLFNFFSSIVGYPAIEIARFNNKLTEDGLLAAAKIINETKHSILKVAIACSFLLFVLTISFIMPFSVLGGIILVALTIISFFFMGMVEPVVKPAEGKSIRRIIRPISLVTVIMLCITLFYWLKPDIPGYWSNVFFMYLVVLTGMSFRSYHGMYVSDAAKGWLSFTAVSLAIILVITKIGFWHSPTWKLVTNSVETTQQSITEVNAEMDLNLYEVKNPSLIYDVGEEISQIVDSGEPVIMAPGDLISVVNGEEKTYGNETFLYCYLMDEGNLFTLGPHYIPAKNIAPYTPKTETLEVVNTSKVEEVEEKSQVDKNIISIPLNLNIGQKYFVHTKTGAGFYTETTSYGKMHFASGQQFEVKTPPPQVVIITPDIKGDKAWVKVL